MNHILVILRTYDGLKEWRLFTSHHAVPVKLSSILNGPKSGVWLNIHPNFLDFWRLELQTVCDACDGDKVNPSSHHIRSCCSKKSCSLPKPHRRLQDVVFLKDLFLQSSLKNSVSSPSYSHSQEEEQLCQLNNAITSMSGIDLTSSEYSPVDSVSKSLWFQQQDSQTCNRSDSDDHTRCSDSLPAHRISDSHTSNSSKIPSSSTSSNSCVHVAAQRVCNVFLNAHTASALWSCVNSSHVFREHLLNNLRGKFQRCPSAASSALQCTSSGHSSAPVVVEVNCVLDIVSVWPVQRLDYAWGWRMNHMLTRRILLEEAMAWLSTLGGAHSSLGEYFQHHAEQAGRVSLKQLKVALEMGDPLTVARCHMFWAYSLLQRGHLSQSIVIVRRVYRLATSYSVTDTRLINMCQSAWRRLQHLHRLHRQQEKRVRGAAIETAPECQSTVPQSTV